MKPRRASAMLDFLEGLMHTELGIWGDQRKTQMGENCGWSE